MPRPSPSRRTQLAAAYADIGRDLLKGRRPGDARPDRPAAIGAFLKAGLAIPWSTTPPSAFWRSPKWASPSCCGLSA